MAIHRWTAVVFVAGLVALGLLAGGVSGAIPATDGTVVVVQEDASTDAPEEEEPAAGPVNVTVETLHLRNVTLTNVSVDHVHVLGTVTAERGTVIETPNGSETVENITADRLFVTEATLYNVSLTGLTVRDDSLVDALENGSMADHEAGAETIASATLEDMTVEGVAVEHGTVRDAHLGTVDLRAAEDVEDEPETDEDEPETDEDESEAPAAGELAAEIHSATVENATVERIDVVGLSVGNETVTDEQGTDEPAADEPATGGCGC